MKKRINISKCFAFFLVVVLLLVSCAPVEETPPEITPTSTPDIKIDRIEIPDDYGFVWTLTANLSKKKLAAFNEKRSYITYSLSRIYGFCGNRSFECDYETATETPFIIDGLTYVSCESLAEAFSLDLQITGESLIFTYDNYSFSISTSSNEITIDGNVFPFYKPLEYSGEYFLNIENFAKLMDYSYELIEEDIIVMKTKEEIDFDIEAVKAQYKNYDEIVYGEDVTDYDTTGVGLYKKSDTKDRLVGVAYTTWFWSGRDWSKNSMWDTPLLGAYTSFDKDVMRQHAIWLRDAGVDFVFVDWSNNIEYDPETMRSTRNDFKTIEESTELLFEVWSEIPNAPKICIFTGPGHVQSSKNDCINNGLMEKKNNQIYNTFLNNEKYKDMYFYYEGKPLLLCYAATPSFIQNNVNPVNDDRFTIRWITGFIGQQGALYDQETLVSKMFWSWEERGAQTFTVKNNVAECMTISAATRSQGTEGGTGYIPAALRNNGETFKRQWARARAVGVQIALIVSFNEWVNGEQISLENSKDIEPSKTYGTLYLDIMREQIRRFKSIK